ncbi:hypothetical protein V5N11_016577 [Cardamine amara subsp. amara]|uniref:Uncharacterized protein n=1 Tax=Cardamine amara subsp. amara TaxID=228776 RepID=A0ABD0Z6C6_CARAN
MEACESEIREGGKAKKGPTESGVNPGSSGGLVYVRRRVEVVDTAKATKEATQGATTTTTTTGTSSRHRLEWEERYHNLQMLLNKLNDSDQTEDHVQMLWSLSAAELSRHAVELEKRSIQFSLEEAREMQRVAALNVLGRSANSLKSSTSNDA